MAKLQGKVGKFGLIQDGALARVPESGSGIEEEALEILVQLQYKRPEAKEMVRLARERAPNITSAEGLLNEVYKQKVKR